MKPFYDYSFWKYSDAANKRQASVAHTTPRKNLDFFRHFLIASSYEEVLLIQQTIDVQILSLG